MARGFSQKEGEDYDETFAPVTRYTTIISIVSMGCNLHYMDLKIVFLNGVIEEEVYIDNLKVLSFMGKNLTFVD